MNVLHVRYKSVTMCMQVVSMHHKLFINRQVIIISRHFMCKSCASQGEFFYNWCESLCDYVSLLSVILICLIILRLKVFLVSFIKFCSRVNWKCYLIFLVVVSNQNWIITGVFFGYDSIFHQNCNNFLISKDKRHIDFA